MKICGAYNHPDNWRNHFAACPTIRVNGRDVVHVTEADDVIGYVIFELVDENGTPKRDEFEKCIATEWLWGNVEIIGERL